MNKIKIIDEILRRQKLELSEEAIRSHLNVLTTSRRLFSHYEQEALVIKLLEKWKQRGQEKVIIEIVCIDDKIDYPRVVAFGVLSSDWPGLSDTCIGIIHKHGWNIHFIKGLIIEHKEKDLGIMLIAIKVDSIKEERKLWDTSDDLIASFYHTSTGSIAKTKLLSGETNKLEIYSRVIARIEEIYTKSDIGKLIGDDGETVKFFTSRSQNYLEERAIGDLAEEIITNYELINMARQPGATIQINIRNIITTREHLTIITMVGSIQELSLNNTLRTLEYIIPNFQRKYDKIFTTLDGFTCIKLCIVDSENNPIPEAEHNRVHSELLKMAIFKKSEKLKWTNSVGGFEHYLRAIIPFLLRECHTSGQNQVFFGVWNVAEFNIEFKIIIVLSLDRVTMQGWALHCAKELEQIKGFHILSTKTPQVYGSEEVNVIDLKVDLEEFGGIEEVYSTIREQIKFIIGTFRDFDEGIRKMDMQKFQQVRKKIPEVSDKLLREFYHNLEEFYRIGAPVEELSNGIELGIKLLNQTIAQRKPHVITANVFLEGQKQPFSSLLILAFPQRWEILNDYLEILKYYDITLSKIDRYMTTVLICRIGHNKKPLSDKELENITKQLMKTNDEYHTLEEYNPIIY